MSAQVPILITWKQYIKDLSADQITIKNYHQQSYQAFEDFCILNNKQGVTPIEITSDLFAHYRKWLRSKRKEAAVVKHLTLLRIMLLKERDKGAALAPDFNQFRIISLDSSPKGDTPNYIRMMAITISLN